MATIDGPTAEDAMASVSDLPLSPADLHERAEAFGVDRFENGMAAVVSETLEQPHAW